MYFCEVSCSDGSLFFGFTHKYGRFRHTSSMGVGRGSIKNLHIEGQTGDELTEAYLYDFGTIVYVPFVSVDYEITLRLLLTTQISYFIANDMKYQSPVIKAGLLFNR